MKIKALFFATPKEKNVSKIVFMQKSNMVFVFLLFAYLIVL